MPRLYKKYEMLSYTHYEILAENMPMYSGEAEATQTIKRINGELEETIFIKVGGKLKEEGILSSDMEYRKLVFDNTDVGSIKVSAVVLDKKEGKVKQANISKMYNEVLEDMGVVRLVDEPVGV